MFLTALALHAAVAQQQCRTLDANLPADLSGWKTGGRDLNTGRSVTLAAGRNGALETRVTIRKAGTFGVALDQPGWIDVAPLTGKVLTSSAHGYGPRCSTIRRIVRYQLRPGTYRVSVTKLKEARARLMLVRY